jgi:hypothetical protein
MSTIRSIPSAPATTFPTGEVTARLHKEITRLWQDTAGIRELWQPALDSLAVAGIVSAVETLLANFKIAPEKVVRKGGYSSVEEAVDDVAKRLERQWLKRKIS